MKSNLGSKILTKNLKKYPFSINRSEKLTPKKEFPLMDP